MRWDRSSPSDVHGVPSGRTSQIQHPSHGVTDNLRHPGGGCLEPGLPDCVLSQGASCRLPARRGVCAPPAGSAGNFADNSELARPAMKGPSSALGILGKAGPPWDGPKSSGFCTSPAVFISVRTHAYNSLFQHRHSTSLLACRMRTGAQYNVQ